MVAQAHWSSVSSLDFWNRLPYNAFNEKASSSDLSPQAEACAWVPEADGDPRWARGPQASSPKGPLATRQGLIDARLRPRNRLRLSERFNSIRRQGSWMRGQFMAIGALPNQLNTSRVGIRVQRGLKRAVDRNRIKRVFRAIYRRKRTRLQPGFDIVVVLYKDAIDTAKVEQDFVKVCKRLKICLEDS